MYEIEWMGKWFTITHKRLYIKVFFSNFWLFVYWFIFYLILICLFAKNKMKKQFSLETKTEFNRYVRLNGNEWINERIDMNGWVKYLVLAWGHNWNEFYVDREKSIKYFITNKQKII